MNPLLPVSPHLAYGHRTGIERFFDRELPSVLRHPLAEVALLVEQADADEGEAEVAGFFEVVARQDSKTARIDGNRRVHAELGAEVGDARRGQVAVRLPIPASPLLEYRLKLRHHCIVLTEEHRVARRLREPVDVHPPQHFNGVLAGQSPQRPVQTLKQSARFLVPRPPQVIREALEARDSRR